MRNSAIEAEPLKPGDFLSLIGGVHNFVCRQLAFVSDRIRPSEAGLKRKMHNGGKKVRLLGYSN